MLDGEVDRSDEPAVLEHSGTQSDVRCPLLNKDLFFVGCGTDMLTSHSWKI